MVPPSNARNRSGLERSRPNARGRAAGRVTLQERQKQDSREKVVAAAREVLDEMPYALVAVEDIIARAGVSRATFYRHFASKFAVGKALHDEFWPRLFKLYGGLSAMSNPSEQALARWVGTLLDFYRSERTLVVAFQQMMVIEPEFEPFVNQISQQVIQAFANSSPALACLLEESKRGRRARVDARLLLEQLDDFLYAAVVHDWMEDVEDGLRIMARNFRRLLDDLAAVSPVTQRPAGRVARRS